MIQLPSTLLEPPAPAPHGSDPPDRTGSHPPPPSGAPFSTVLDDHQARTAVAEGHQTADPPRAPVAEREAHDAAAEAGRDGDGDEAGDRTDPTPSAGADASALAALLGGVPLPPGAGRAIATLSRAAAAPASAGSATPAPGTPGANGAATAGGRAAATTIASGPSVPATASSLALGAVSSGAVSSGPTLAALGGGGVPATAGPIAAPGGAAAAIEALQAATAHATALHPAAAAAASTPAATAAATPAAARGAGTGERTAAPAARSADAPTPPGAAPASAPAQPAPASTQPTPAADARGVGLEHAVETVRLALRASAERGVTHARISLTPRELGAIEVHLRQTADGLVARVVAQHATAAQLLQHAGGELRRSLESHGLTLLRLDIGASGEQGDRAGDRRALARDAGGDDSGGDRIDDQLAPLGGAAETTSTATLALPDGALVDVLA